MQTIYTTRFITYLTVTAVILAAAVLPGVSAYAQSVSNLKITDLEITEVMYNPLNGGEWIEIINNSDSAVDITTLKVSVAGGRSRR